MREDIERVPWKDERLAYNVTQHLRIGRPNRYGREKRQAA